MNRYSNFGIALVLAAGGLHGQTATGFSAELKQMYTGIKNNLTRMAEKVPEEDYSFKATPEVRTFGQLVAHIADSQARTCSAASGGEAKNLGAAQKTSKADLVAALKESFSICDAAYEGLSEAKGAEMVKTPRGERSRFGMLAGNVAHLNEEYGYMSVYLRLKNIVPPSSEKR